jgi:hypothetical protein
VLLSAQPPTVKTTHKTAIMYRVFMAYLVAPAGATKGFSVTVYRTDLAFPSQFRDTGTTVS